MRKSMTLPYPSSQVTKIGLIRRSSGKVSQRERVTLNKSGPGDLVRLLALSCMAARREMNGSMCVANGQQVYVRFNSFINSVKRWNTISYL